MAGFVGVLVSDPWLQSQFTQVELRTLKSRVCLPNYVGLLAFCRNNFRQRACDFGMSCEISLLLLLVHIQEE